MTATPRHALTFDIEDWHQLVERRLTGRPARCSPHVLAQTREILEVLARDDVMATFFILGPVAEAYPDLVREIHRAGHEVGSHGWSHRLVYRQTPDEFAAETRQSRDVLEDILGTRVVGYRAAEFSVTRDSRWALDVLADLGFEYDSSVFPVAGSRYGIAGSPLVPYRVRTAGGRTILEVPLTVARWRGRAWPVGGGGYFRLFPYAVTRAAITQVAREGRAAVAYFHPYEFSARLLRLDLPWWQQWGRGARFTLFHNLNRHANRRRFRRLLADFRFTSMAEMLTHGHPDEAVL